MPDTTSAPSSVISRPTCFSSSLRCCWQVGSAPFVRRRCDCSASSAPFTYVQTYLLTYHQCWWGRWSNRTTTITNTIISSTAASASCDTDFKHCPNLSQIQQNSGLLRYMIYRPCNLKISNHHCNRPQTSLSSHTSKSTSYYVSQKVPHVIFF